MFITRWQITSHLGDRDECIDILRRWKITIGERFGWEKSDVRVTVGVLGTDAALLEFEARVDSFAALERIFVDLERDPRHSAYMKELDRYIAPGSSKWTVLREVALGED